MSPTTEMRLGAVRGMLPAPGMTAVVAARTSLAWRRPAVQEDALAQMRFVLEHTQPGADIEAAARAYVRYQARRGELRWHPALINRLPVQGLEHLTAAKDRGRGVVLSFMHHAHYEGGFASIARLGVPCHMVVYPYMLRDDAPVWLKQHIRVGTSNGGVPVSADVGTEGLVDLLGQGAVLAIASDVPGHTPMRFFGRDVVGSFGAVRLAAATGSPLVVMTSELGTGGLTVRLHEPLDPAGFGSARELLDVILPIHEAAQVAWPEAIDIPLSRWGTADVGAHQ
jgi:lauroyl/myristoyl acyltransferase